MLENIPDSKVTFLEYFHAYDIVHSLLEKAIEESFLLVKTGTQEDYKKFSIFIEEIKKAAEAFYPLCDGYAKTCPEMAETLKDLKESVQQSIKALECLAKKYS